VKSKISKTSLKSKSQLSNLSSDGCVVKVTKGAVDNVNASTGATVGMEIGADGSVGSMTVGDNVSVNTSGEDTEEKLADTEFKMASETSSSEVDINGKTTHVHEYYFQDVVWDTFDKEAMNVKYAMECNSCMSMDPDHMTYRVTEVLSRTEQPTCTADGSVTYYIIYGTSIIENPAKDVLHATGHNYSVEFTWSNDHSSATYVAVCANDTTHRETGIVDSQVISRTDATCTADGSAVYRVSVELAGKTFSDEKTVALPKGHPYTVTDVDMSTLEQGTTQQDTTVVATAVCDACDANTPGHEVTERMQVVVYSYEEPNCREGIPGSLSIVLLFNGEEMPFHEEYPAGHDFRFYSVDSTDPEHPTITIICRTCQTKVENIPATPVISDRVEPTCTADGSYRYHAECTYEGIVYSSADRTVTVPALGHQHHYEFIWADDNSSATCVVTCERDGCDYRDTIRANVGSQCTATCTEAGQTIYTATAIVSDGTIKTDTKRVDAPALGHQYVITSIDWNTLDREGMTVTANYECSVCDESADGHTTAGPVAVSLTVTDPTCIYEGYKHYFVEGFSDNGYNDIIDPLGHSCEYEFVWSQDYSSATLHEECMRDGCDYEKDYRAAITSDIVAPTCVEGGTITYTATVTPDHGPQQTDTQVVEIPTNGHSYVITGIDWNTLDRENMTVMATFVCEACSEDTDGHSKNEAISVRVESTPATCFSDGNNRYYVPNMEYWYDEVIPAEHDLVHHDGQAATCTEAGWEPYDACRNCNYNTYQEIPALGHDLIHHAAQAPAIGEPGWGEYDTCSRCDYTTYQEIPALHGYTVTIFGGHVALKGQVSDNSVITVAENTVVTVTYTGDDFGYWLDDYGDYIPGESFDILVTCDLFVTAHDTNDREYGEWVKVRDPTCTETGQWYCESDGFRQYRSEPALGHISSGDFIVDTPATCTTAGSGHTVCERCQEEIVEVIPATGHSYVFTPEIEAHGSTVGKMRGECEECGNVVLRDYISPVYPSGDMVVVFDWSHVRYQNGSIPSSDRDETHTMWTFTDEYGFERQAYLYRVQLDQYRNGYISGVDVTSWFFWVDYGTHSPVYVARHNGQNVVYGGNTEDASWAVAGYVDNFEELIYFLDNLSAGVTIGGEEYRFTIGMDNGRTASALFDLYDAWADVFNAGKAGLYEAHEEDYLGWHCTVYSNDDESFYVNEDNCCVRWGRSNIVDGIEFGDILAVKSVATEFTKPFTNGYWNSNDFPLFSAYYFNDMPTLENSTYLCVKLIDGYYNSGDFTQSNYNRINFYNADSRDLLMQIDPNLGEHQKLDRIEVLNQKGVWVTVPTMEVNGHYVFDFEGGTIAGLYMFMMDRYPNDFVPVYEYPFIGVYLRCIISDIEPDSTVTVNNGTFRDGSDEYKAEGSVYGGRYISLEFDDVAGMKVTGITITVNGESQTSDNYYNYQVPEDSTVTITPIYESATTAHIEFRTTPGGTIDAASGDYVVDTTINAMATPGFGFRIVGWYDITEDPDSREQQVGWGPELGYWVQEDAVILAVFQHIGAELLEQNYTKVYATNGFVHWDEVSVYLSALYGNPETGERMYVHADPNLEPVHRWDMTSYAEDPNSRPISMFPADDWFDGNVKYCGQITNVIAVFESQVNYYSVTYDLHGAEADIPEGYYADDVEFVVADEPEWEGHNFLGWNTAADGSGTGYDAGCGYLLTGDLVLHAVWELKHKDITLFGPSNAPYVFDNEKKNISVTYGETVNVPEGVITLYGCSLIGWEIQINGETTVISDTGEIPYDVDSSIVRAVVGDFDEYHIRFSNGSVTTDNTMEEIVFTVEDIQNLKISWSSSYNYHAAWYTLTGWTCNIDGVSTTKTSIDATNGIKKAGFIHGGTFDLTAEWDPVTYVFDFKKGTAPAGTINGYGGRLSFIADDTFTFQLDAATNKLFTCSGYTLVGFNTSSGMTEALYEYGQTVDTNVLLSDPRFTFTDGAYGMLEELYPVWAKNQYTVYFFPEQGSNDHYDQTINYGATANLAAISSMGDAFQRDGCILLGWTGDGIDGILTDGQEIRNLTTTGSISLYAVWAYETYTVHFDKNDQNATGEMEDQSFNADESKALTPNGFQNEGYVFDHWCTVSGNQGVNYTDGQTVSNLTTGPSITLYAIWVQAP